MFDRSLLWSSVEAAEKRRDAQLAREFELSLPRELPPAARRRLLERWIREELLSIGMVVDANIHNPRAKDGGDQPHAHLLCSTRGVSATGWGKKRRDWNSRGLLVKLRKSWEHAINRALTGAGIGTRVSCESYANRGDERTAQPKIGPLGTAIRDGKRKPRKSKRYTQSEQAEPQPSNASGDAEDLHKLADEYVDSEEAERLNDFDRLNRHKAWSGEMAKKIAADPRLLLRSLFRDGLHTFDGRDLARMLWKMTGGWLEPLEFQNLIARAVAHPEIVFLANDPFTHQPVYTSRSILLAERNLLQRADRLIARRAGGVAIPYHVRLTTEPDVLNICQQVLRGGYLSTIAGPAGAGKTTLLKALNEIWRSASYNVFGAAVAATAAEKLEQESRIPSTTLASLLLQIQKGKIVLDRRSVVVVDEASMVSFCDFGKLLSAVERVGARILFLGDASQIPPVLAVSPFSSIHRRNPHGATMRKTRRHENPLHRQATEAFFHGDFQKGFDLHCEAKTFAGYHTDQEAEQAVLSEWLSLRPAGQVAMIAFTNRSVDRLNMAARELLQRAGLMGPDKAAIIVADRQSGDQRKLAIALGEEIVFLKNEWKLGVKNGTAGVVRSITRRNGVPVLRVQVVDAKGVSRMIEVDTAAYKHLSYGYAATAHRLQGQTVEHTVILADPSLDGSLAYSALSRHRETVKMHWSVQTFARRPGDGPEDAFANLRRAATRLPKGRMASDYLYPGAGHARDFDFAAGMRARQRRHAEGAKESADVLAAWIKFHEEQRAERYRKEDDEFRARAERQGWSSEFVARVLRQRADDRVRTAEPWARKKRDEDIARMKAQEARTARSSSGMGSSARPRARSRSSSTDFSPH